MVLILLAGVALVVLEGDEESSESRDVPTAGPLGAARWSVSSAALAATEGPPAQLRTVGGLVLAVHGGALHAFDPATGALAWSRPAHPDERIARSLGEPSVAATLIAADHDPEVTLTTVDPTTGATLWTHRTELPEAPLAEVDEADGSGPTRGLVVTPGAILLRSDDADGPVLTGLDPATGEELWSRSHGGHIAAADDALAVLLERPPGDELATRFNIVELATGSTRWEVDLDADGVDVIPAARIVPGGLVIIADGAGHLRGHDRRGGEVVWERPESRRGETLALSAEQIIVTQDRTRTYVGLDAADGFLRWHHDWLVPGPVGLDTTEGRAVIASADDRVIGLSLEHGSRVWEQRLERAGSLTVAGASAVHADRRGRLSGTSVATGRQLWSVGLPSAARIQLAASDGAVFTVAPRGTTENHVLTAWAEGDVVWSTILRRVGIGPPTIGDGALIIPDEVVAGRSPDPDRDGGPLTAVEVATGELRWTSGDSSAAIASRPTRLASDDRIVIRALPDVVHAYERASGSHLWHAADVELVTSPAIVGSRVVVGTADAGVLSLDREDGRDVRRSPLDADPVTLAGGEGGTWVVTADASLVALDEAGTTTWVAPLPGLTHHAPLPIDGTIVVAVGGVALGLDADNGRELWSAELPGPLAGPPVPSGHLVLVATTDGALLALDPRTGATVDHYLLGPIHAGPVSAGGLSYVVTQAGELVAIGPQDPDETVPSPPPIHPR